MLHKHGSPTLCNMLKQNTRLLVLLPENFSTSNITMLLCNLLAPIRGVVTS